jgi:hypothetical protein
MRQKLFHAYWVGGKNYSTPTQYGAKIIPHLLSILAPIALKLLKCLQIRAQATLASGIGSLESIPGLLKHLQLQAQATLDIGIFSLESIPGLFKRLQIRAQATLSSGIGSLESIPGLSLSPYLETLKEPKNQFQGTREPRNPGTKNRLSISASRGVDDSPYQRVGELLSEL